MGADGTVHYEITGSSASLAGAAARGESALGGMASKASLLATTLAGVGFGGMIARGLQFNKTMADSETAIGKVLKQFKGLSDEAAKGEAANAMRQLIELEPKAAGTLADLTSGFLATVAASQQAGISVEQNIDLVGRFANALGNANLPANQLAQEMRSILTGNIGADSALAKILNITNDAVQSAREAGNLYGFLVGRIGALGEAGDTAAVTFSSLQSAIDKALGITTQSLFKEVIGNAKSLTAVVDANTESFKALGEAIGMVARAGGAAFEFLSNSGKGLAIGLDALLNGRSLKESGKAFDAAMIDKAAQAHLDKFGVKDEAGGAQGLAGAAKMPQPPVAPPPAAPVGGADGDAADTETDAGGRRKRKHSAFDGVRSKIRGYSGKQRDARPKTVFDIGFNDFFNKEETAFGQKSPRRMGDQSFNEFFHPRDFLEPGKRGVKRVPALEGGGGADGKKDGKNEVKDATAAQKLDSILEELKRISTQ